MKDPFFLNGEIIDGKYAVTGVCSDKGGMGNILFVNPVASPPPYPIVLKYCKSTESEVLQRFNREIRNMVTFAGNSKVVQIYDHNLSHKPPYFVMKYFSDGDLTTLCTSLTSNYHLQERTFIQMVDCVNELHAKGLQHRDIKPQNFLQDGNTIMVSDLGLSKEIGAGTTCTMSHEFWGTQGYLPPEFVSAGFKNAEASSDIFMLGKSFYYLLTERDPLYITDADIHPAVFHLIEKCCAVEKQRRFQSLADLKQGLSLAFDVVLNRALVGSKARQIFSQIIDRLRAENTYDPEQVMLFVNLLASLPRDEQDAVIFDLPREFFIVVSMEPLSTVLETFLKSYEPFVQPSVKIFSYAEVVANNMKEIFRRAHRVQDRAKALELAVNAAIWANRFVAMDTCREMVMSIDGNDLGLLVSTIITENKDSFLTQIEPAACKNDIIKKALRETRGTSEAQ
ncbi:MAG: protein kinase [Thermodesulfovibrionales bacterium]